MTVTCTTSDTYVDVAEVDRFMQIVQETLTSLA